MEHLEDTLKNSLDAMESRIEQRLMEIHSDKENIKVQDQEKKLGRKSSTS